MTLLSNLVTQYHLLKVNNCIDCQYRVIRNVTDIRKEYGYDQTVICAINMQTIVERSNFIWLRDLCARPEWCPVTRIEHPLPEDLVMEE